MSRLPIQIASLLLALLALACNSIQEFPVSDQAAARAAATCAADTDCAGGLVCNPTRHRCTVDEPLPYRVSVNIAPPQGSGWVQTQLTDLDPRADHHLDLALSTPLHVTGPISMDGLDDPSFEPIHIVAQSPADIPSWPDFQFTGAIEWDADRGAFLYDLALLPNRPYRVSVFFDEPAFPLVVREEHFTSQDRGDEVRIEVSPTREVSGVLRFASGDPVAGIRLVAVATGSGTVYSSTETGDQGAFALFLPEELEAFRLEARASEHFPGFPRQTLIEEVGQYELHDGGLYMVPDLPPSALHRFEILDDFGQAVPDVDLSLQASLPAGEVSLTLQADERGVIEAALISGDYAFGAAPPIHAPQAVRTGTLSLAQDETTHVIQLSGKVAARVEVSEDVSGGPVVGADVFLSLTGLSSGAEAMERLYHMVTDGDGAADGLAEDGRYQLMITPAAHTGLPRWRVDEVWARDDAPIAVSVPRPWLLHGRVVGTDGVAIPHTTLQFVATPSPKDAAAPSAGILNLTPNQERLFQVIGEVITDQEGRYEVFLPASL